MTEDHDTFADESPEQRIAAIKGSRWGQPIAASPRLAEFGFREHPAI